MKSVPGNNVNPTELISALLGHATPMAGFGYSRMTPGYAHAIWETMVEAVATIENPLPARQGNVANADDSEKMEEKKEGELTKQLRKADKLSFLTLCQNPAKCGKTRMV